MTMRCFPNSLLNLFQYFITIDPRHMRSLSGPGYPERSACLLFLESSHEAKFQERLIRLDEAWLFSTIKPLKCKVYIFHYVPLLCPLSTKREVNVVNNVPHSSFLPRRSL